MPIKETCLKCPTDGLECESIKTCSFLYCMCQNCTPEKPLCNIKTRIKSARYLAYTPTDSGKVTKP
jgi:hypothetical protein